MRSSASASFWRSRTAVRGSPSTVVVSEVRSWASSAVGDRLAHGEVGEQVGLLERAAGPGRGALPTTPGRGRGRAVRSGPGSGTKPLIAFMSVDLPAPFAPISPTTAPSSSSMLTSSTAAMPPKRTESCSTRTWTPCRRRVRVRSTAPKLSKRAARRDGTSPRDGRGRRGTGADRAPGTAMPIRPPGKYMSRKSRPMPLVSSAMLGSSPKAAGRPMTHARAGPARSPNRDHRSPRSSRR